MPLSETLLIISVAVVILIFYDKPSNRFEEEIKEFTGKVLKVLGSKEFYDIHPLLHFNVLACMLRDEIVISGRTSNSKFIKQLTLHTWKLYIKSPRVTELLDLIKRNSKFYGLFPRLSLYGLKTEFFTQVYSIPVNMNYSNLSNRDKVNTELKEFSYLIRNPDSSIRPISMVLQTYSKETLSVIVNHLKFIKGFKDEDFNLPTDLIILSWLADNIKDKTLRNFHLPLKTYWVLEKDKGIKNGITLIVENLGYLSDDHTSLNEVVSDYLSSFPSSVKTVEEFEVLASEFERISNGLTPHETISFQSDKFAELSSNSKNRFFTINL